MKTTTSTLDAPEGVALFVYRWLPETPAKAVVQIAHGWGERAGRYASGDLLNEINRDEVTRDLIRWLNSVVARVARPSLSAASAR